MGAIKDFRLLRFIQMTPDANDVSETSVTKRRFMSFRDAAPLPIRYQFMADFRNFLSRR